MKTEALDQRPVGYFTQDANDFPHLRVGENVLRVDERQASRE
jgi:ABC-type molybdate transport system ATPase subunit